MACITSAGSLPAAQATLDRSRVGPPYVGSVDSMSPEVRMDKQHATCCLSAGDTARFADGMSPDGFPYRTYQGRSGAVWMYAETFMSQGAAQDFCKAAGATLGVPTTPAEQLELFVLLSKTVLSDVTNIHYAFKAGPFRDQFAAWIGLNMTTASQQWQTVTGQPVDKSIVWDGVQPNKTRVLGKESCAVLVCVTPRFETAPASDDQHNLSWQDLPPQVLLPWECQVVPNHDPLPAICRTAASLPGKTRTQSAGLVNLAAAAGNVTVLGRCCTPSGKLASPLRLGGVCLHDGACSCDSCKLGSQNIADALSCRGRLADQVLYS